MYNQDFSIGHMMIVHAKKLKRQVNGIVNLVPLLVLQTFIGNCASLRLTEPLDTTIEDLGTLALSMRTAIQSCQDVACREYAWMWEVG